MALIQQSSKACLQCGGVAKYTNQGYWVGAYYWCAACKKEEKEWVAPKIKLPPSLVPPPIKELMDRLAILKSINQVEDFYDQNKCLTIRSTEFVSSLGLVHPAEDIIAFETRFVMAKYVHFFYKLVVYPVDQTGRIEAKVTYG